MRNAIFISDVQRFTAVSAVGVSALRRQGSGALGKMHHTLGSMNLAETNGVHAADDFAAWLEIKTDQLASAAGIKWGAARKALNLFLRDCLYNKHLSSAYHHLAHLEPWMEMPLDSVIAGQLKRDAGRGRLPVWQGLKHLTKPDSLRFQNHASTMATR